MLIDTITNREEREPLRQTLSRRVTYLASRARSVSTRESDGSDSWRKPMLEETLWIEAAEGAVALGQFKQAREYLYRAVSAESGRFQGVRGEAKPVGFGNVPACLNLPYRPLRFISFASCSAA